jgi:hypothetical protein
MNRTRIITILSAAAILLLSGCRKFLKERSQDEMTPTTIASLNEIMAREGYPYINTSSSAYDGYALCEYLNWLDDDVKLLNERNQSGLVDYVKPFYAWSDNMYQESATAGYWTPGGKNPYQILYNRIRGCNVVMDLLPEVSGSAEEKEQLQGEALTLRAYYYFMLVNLYAWPYNDPVHDKSSSAGVPIIRSGGISDQPVGRSTVKEVYDFIAADIEKASSLLEKQKSITTPYRINYRSAWLLASRIYLHMEEWDNVIVYADKLIGNYPIVTDLNTWKVPTQGLNSNSTANANFIDPANTEVLFLFSGVKNGDLHWNGSGSLSLWSIIASPDLISIYEPNDMRFGMYSATNPQPNFFLNYLSSYYMASKLNGAARAGRCFRMSEAYVNRAEAYIRKAISGGDASLLQKALDDLNFLRVKRFKAGAANAVVTLANFSNDPKQVLNFYKAERRREFCFEEFRWFDLRRYGMPEIVHVFNPNEPKDLMMPVQTYILPQGSKRYLMKIPSNIIEANPALIQND